MNIEPVSYTHLDVYKRQAISNYRIKDMTESTVTFSAKDYKNQGLWKEITISGEEFIRRFLMHVPPKRFVRIRPVSYTHLDVYKRQLWSLCTAGLCKRPGQKRSSSDRPGNTLDCREDF